MGAENMNVPENSKTETTESRELSGATLEQVNEELLTINRIITAIAGVSDLDEILRKVLDEALAITGIEGGTICMVTPQDTLELTACRATSEATITDLTTNEIKIGDCLCGAAARDHKPLILRDREEVLKFSSREAARGEDIRFHAAFPLITGNRCLGVLCVFTRTDKKPLERRLQLLETVTAQIAMAMENAQLYTETVQHAAMLEDKVRELNQIKNYNRVLFEESAIGLALCRMDGQFVDVNPAFAAIIGRTIGETLKLTYWNITPEKYADQEAQRLEFLRTTGRYGPYEKEYIRKDGSLVPVRLQGRIIESEGVKFILSGVEDIFDKKKVEVALQEKERLLSESQQIAHIGSWRLDFKSTILWTDETYRIYGVSPETFIPTTDSFIKLIHPDDRSLMQRWIEECATGKTPGELVFRTVLPDGSVRFISGRGELKYDSENRPSYMAGTAQDITERKKAEEELAQHARDLSSLATASKEISLSSVHENIYDAVCRIMTGNFGLDMVWLEMAIENIGEKAPVAGESPEEFDPEQTTFVWGFLRGDQTNISTAKLPWDIIVDLEYPGETVMFLDQGTYRVINDIANFILYGGRRH